MGALDAAVGQAVEAALGAVGGSGTYIRAGTGGTYNPDTGNIEGASTETTTSVSVGPGPAARNLFDETVIETGDETAIIARTELGFRPDPGADELTWKGEARRIVEVEQYGSGDEDAAYALLLRR